MASDHRADLSHLSRLAAIVAAVLLSWIGLFALGSAGFQRYANHRKDQLAVELSSRLGRPVRIGHLDVRWFPHPGVDVAGLTVGGDAAAGESGPALDVHR